LIGVVQACVGSDLHKIRPGVDEKRERKTYRRYNLALHQEPYRGMQALDITLQSQLHIILRLLPLHPVSISPRAKEVDADSQIPASA
jgi:hypothetical protein